MQFIFTKKKLILSGGLELTTSGSQVQYAIYYAIEPHVQIPYQLWLFIHILNLFYM